MRRNDAKKAKTKSRDEKQPAQPTRVPVNLKRRAPVNTSSAPAFSSAEVVIEVDNLIAAIYRDNGRVYIGKLTDVDESDAFVSFLEHRGEMSNISTFVKPKSPDKVWVRRRDVLCVIPVSQRIWSAADIVRWTLFASGLSPPVNIC